jgi:hypothetical protein
MGAPSLVVIYQMISLMSIDVYMIMEGLCFALAFGQVLGESMLREADIAPLSDHEGIAGCIPVDIARFHPEACSHLFGDQEPIGFGMRRFPCPNGHSKPQRGPEPL